MLAFLSVAFLVYATMHIYVLSKVWFAFPQSFPLGLALALFGLAMSFSPFLLWFLVRQGWHGVSVVASWVAYLWMGFVFLFCCIGLTVDLGHAAATLLHLRWPVSDVMLLRAITLLTVVLLGYGFVDARRIRVEQVDISTPKLPFLVGEVTIAQVSDLHLGLMRGDTFLQQVMERVCAMQPDMIVATGDIVDGQGDELSQLAKGFHACKPAHGAFAIIGNHEAYGGLEASVEFLQRAGFTVLRGEATAVRGIVIAGVDDPSVQANGALPKLDARAALASMPTGAFVVLLKHQPVVEEDIPFDLQLSGHVHGGQIFPFSAFTRLAYGVHPGLTQLAPARWLYVSRGAGTWGPPVRVFAPPEVTLFKIRAGAEPRASVN